MKDKMLAIYSPTAEEDNIPTDNQLYNLMDPSYGTSRAAALESALRNSQRFGSSKTDNFVQRNGNANECAFNHFEHNTCESGDHSYFSTSRANIPQYSSGYNVSQKDISMNYGRALSGLNWYDFDLAEHNVFEHNVFEHSNYFPSDHTSLPVNGKDSRKLHAKSTDRFERDGVIVPHIFESRSAMPQVITPITPDHPKSTKEFQSLMAMSMHMNLHMNTNGSIDQFANMNTGKNFGTNPENMASRRPKVQAHRSFQNIGNLAYANARSRFNSVPNLTLSTFEQNPSSTDLIHEFEEDLVQNKIHDHFHANDHQHYHGQDYDPEISHSHLHEMKQSTSHDCTHDRVSTDLDATSLSYEELRSSIIEKFTFNTIDGHMGNEGNHDGLSNGTPLTDANAVNPDGSSKSVLQQILDDKPLMEAISKKQKRGAYKCAHCPEMFNTIFEFAQHIDDFQVERKYKCPFPLCPWKILGLPKLQELKRHCLNQHIDQLTPDQLYLIHGKSGLTSKVYHCESPYCDKAFHRRDSHRRHVKMVHKNPKSRFNIRLGKAFKSCPEHLKHDGVAKERYLIQKMNARRR
ncbi:unnamed protein product [Kluyveromyces dobzhanskii CBS 2104]|uniref:WGS project CCBQ000000000 data, contig 00017 n=1 Tax=Kluyveromyces dobzhanskii CBS 2104 TaxID=1427455 RepID=A0A0A8L8B2_9SACH|nr:unnamed protein product [Kluyveromyces dobzhanskii CBS 2104]